MPQRKNPADYAVPGVKSSALPAEDAAAGRKRNATKTHSYSRPTFPWADEEATMEQLLRGWVVSWMLKERNITYSDIAEHLGITRQRAQMLLGEALKTPRDVVNTRMGPKGKPYTYTRRTISQDVSYERLEAAITEITEARGGVYEACGIGEWDQLDLLADVEEWRNNGSSTSDDD